MSEVTPVLFDVPGPHARARQRVATVLALLGLAALIALVTWRLQTAGQLDAARWSPLTYTVIQQALLRGLLTTLQVAALGTALALALGVVLAAGRLSDHVAVRIPATVLVELFRGLPVLFMIFFVFLASGGRVSAFASVVTGLTLYNSAVLAEVFRAGIRSLPRGQSEAAYAIGLGKSGVMRLVLIPQAVRAMLPTVISQVVVLLKDSALGFIVGLPELLRAINSIGNQYFNLLPTFIVGAVIYIAVNLIVSGAATVLERRLRTRGRSRPTSAPRSPAPANVQGVDAGDRMG